MKKITLCILLIITTLLTLSLSRCSNKNNQTIDVIQQKLDNMTLDEKIGQMITIGIDGYSVDDTAKQLITDKKVGGVILFKNNISDSNQLLQLINDIKGINSTNKIPIFISVDQEGGRVNRLPSEIKSLPSNEIIGNKNDNKLAYDIGKI